MACIVTLTLNPTVDRSASVDRVVPERKLRCCQPLDEPGGGGINVSRAITKLGGETRAVYVAGGCVGDKLRDLLAQENIAQDAIKVAAETRLNFIVSDESSGEQYRFGTPSAKLEREEFQRCTQVLQGLLKDGGWLVVSGSLPPGVGDDAVAELAGLLPNVRLIVDTSGEALRRAVEAGVYLIKPNLRELGDLTGGELEGTRQVREAAQALIGEGKVEVVMVSLGGGGAMLITADDAEHVASPTVPIRSKVGAGDSMVAGVAMKLADGASLKEAIRFGVAAGAAAVMTPGTQLCRREDAERLSAEMI